MLFKFLILLSVVIYVKTYVPLDTSCAANSLAQTTFSFNFKNFSGKWYLIDRAYSDLAIGDTCNVLRFTPINNTAANFTWSRVAGNGSTVNLNLTVVKSSVPKASWQYTGNVNPGVAVVDTIPFYVSHLQDGVSIVFSCFHEAKFSNLNLSSVYVLSRTPTVTVSQNNTINQVLRNNKQNRALFLPVLNNNCTN